MANRWLAPALFAALLGWAVGPARAQSLSDPDAGTIFPQAAPPEGWLGFRSSATAPRHIGKGAPLTGSSWLNRPLSFGLFVGPLFNDALIRGRVDQGASVMAGFRLGWDFDHYWGSEMRFAWSGADLRGAPPRSGNSEIFFGDVDLLYYPWGDSRLRPYLLLGVGLANYDFTDDLARSRDVVLLGMPLGGGLKYQVHPRMAFRLEVLDNIAFAGDGLNTLHNLGLTFSLEFRLGGSHKSYFPWQPSRHIW
jgi:opacity protein-like surface antigen